MGIFQNSGCHYTSDSPAFQITKSFAGRLLCTGMARLQLHGGSSMQSQTGCMNSWPVIARLVAVVLTVVAGFGLKYDSTQSLC